MTPSGLRLRRAVGLLPSHDQPQGATTQSLLLAPCRGLHRLWGQFAYCCLINKSRPDGSEIDRYAWDQRFKPFLKGKELVPTLSNVCAQNAQALALSSSHVVQTANASYSGYEGMLQGAQLQRVQSDDTN